jgi:hypothetical protein
MLKHSPIILVPLLLIQACGSSSSSDETPEPSEYQFNLSAKLSNKCGLESSFNQYEVHLQDDNWELITKYSANADGFVSFTTAQKDINYTIVAKTQQGDTAEGLDIVSYYQAQTTTPASYSATYDSLQNNEACECNTQDIELSHKTFSSIDSVDASFSFSEWHHIDEEKTYITDAQVCRDINSQWPVQSIAIRGLDINSNITATASILTDFTSNEEQLWEAFAVQDTYTATLPEEHTGFEMKQVFAAGEHFHTKVNEADQILPVFNSHPYVSESTYNSSSNHIFETLNTIFGQSTFGSYHQVHSTMFEEAFTVAPELEEPNIDNASFSELAADGSYDYSTVSGYPLIKISFDYETDDETPVLWSLYGPIKGQLPSSVQLVGYEEIIGPDTDIEVTDIKIIKSAISNKYDDYIKHYQGAEINEFEDSLRYFHLKLKM